MIIRRVCNEDLNQLKEIHEKFYKDEFSFEEFSHFFIEKFVVTDDDGKIITGGGIRPIAESVLVTDKSFSPLIRREALEQILKTSMHVCQRYHYNQLHAFIQDPSWEKVLRKYNFNDCKGKALYLKF